MGDYSVLADLMARKETGGKTIPWMLDALITAPSEIVNISPENAAWQMPPFSGQPTSSLFFSQDPVEIDSVGADFLVNEPSMQRRNSNMRSKPEMENCPHEAALFANPHQEFAIMMAMETTPAALASMNTGTKQMKSSTAETGVKKKA